MASATGVARTVKSVHQPTEDVVPEIRRHVRAVLAGWNLDLDRIDDAVLVVEELVANAVDHARTEFCLTLRFTGVLLHAAVDDGCYRLPEPQPHDLTARRGRGLQLVDRLTQSWGWTTDAHGKTVWAVLPTFGLPDQRS